MEAMTPEEKRDLSYYNTIDKVFWVVANDIGDLFKQLIGVRAFVPHEHFDPVKQSQFSPREVDKAEREQVSCKTSLLIIVVIAPSWGGGIEK